ncbi:DUF4254 domain-containing protein [Nocardia sp. NPDC004654]|uniref:DUF4254 domain-containing protein n=1 Tax=Nocardia sp. NPDC004654 TaxID=3154776 RepID=UPI0033A36682
MRALPDPVGTVHEPAGAERATATLFPPGEALLSAIRGHHVGVHPLEKIAHRFGLLHQHRLARPVDECRCSSVELVLAVDVWVADRLPVPHPAATLHTETLGTVIDRLAEAQVRAYHLLMTVDPADPIVHAAWYRLAELVDGYTDLITEVTQRARRLPALRDRR